MKKIVLTLVLGVFAFGASGFDTPYSQQDPGDDGVDCFELQLQVFAAYYNAGLEDEAWERSIIAHMQCMDRPRFRN